MRDSAHMDAVLKGRYAAKVFKEKGRELLKIQEREMRQRGFTDSDFFNGRNFSATQKSGTLTHYAVHRFVDMKYRKLKSGQRTKKKAHPIHNAPLFVIANQMIQDLMYGFTEAVRQEMAAVDLNL